jgi:hypothetical protein
MICPICGAPDGTCTSAGYRLAHPPIGDEPEQAPAEAPLRLPRQRQKGAGYVGNVIVYDPGSPAEVRIVDGLPPRPRRLPTMRRGEIRTDR